MNNMLISKVTPIRILLLTLSLPFLVSVYFLNMSSFVSIYEGNLNLYYSLIYIGIVFLTVILYFKFFNLDSNIVTQIEYDNVFFKKVIIILFGLVLIGIFLHLYDKIIIRGYDYSNCIQNIREQWRHDSRYVNSIASSWFSALGYILTFFHFPLIWMILLTGAVKKDHTKYFLILLALAPVSLLSYTVGSRSIMLLAVVHLVGCLLLTLNYQTIKTGLIKILPIFLTSILVLLFFMLVMTKSQLYCNNNYQTAGQTAGQNYQDQYFSGYRSELNIKNREGNRKDRGMTSELIALYANNGAWNFEYTLHQDTQPGVVFFALIPRIFNDLKIIESAPTLPRTYGRGMISLVGSIWYDLSTIGMMLVAMLHGILIIIVVKGLCSKNFSANFLYQITFVNLIIIHLFSPLVFAINLMASPFMLFSYLILAIFIISRGRLSWIKNTNKD